MGEQSSGALTAARAVELLTAAQFQEELRRVTRFRSRGPVGDPIDAAVRRIKQNPAYTQSRLLTRILAALAYQEGEFRRAEIAAFDRDTLDIVIALMDARAGGTSTTEEWISAADQAKTAQAGAGG